MKQQLVTISYDEKTKRHTLWGSSGGQLEFVSKRLEMIEGIPHLILRFTDHDIQATHGLEGCEHIGKDLIEGQFYEVEIPVADYGDIG